MISALTFLLAGGLVGIFAQMPSSSNLKLRDYTIGTGGAPNSSSSNYRAEGITGETSGAQAVGGAYKTNSGLQQTQQANVPSAPAFSNDSNWYNKLHFILNTGNNPTDTQFAIAISDDDFVTTRYIQSDNTVGNTLGTEDYQTYTLWGGATGEDVVGLNPSTTYKIKVKAISGDFTESGYSPAASAATVGAQLSFDIDVAATDTETSPPYTVALGDVLAGSVVTASDKVWFDFASNAESGGNVYIYSQNAGLLSSLASYTISSASTDLASASEGFGARSSSATQSSGGPISVVSPYDGSNDNVGIINATIREIYTTANPIIAGRTSFWLKAKSSFSTPPSTDYTEIITAIASGKF